MNPSPVKAEGSISKGGPSWFTADERRLYRKIAKDLPKGLLRACDEPLFARYIAAMGLFLALRSKLETLRAIGLEDPALKLEAMKAEPGTLRMMTKTTEVMLRMESELGLTPSSRTRVRATEPKIEESEFEKLRREANEKIEAKRFKKAK